MGADWMIAGLRGYQAMDDILFSGTYGQLCPRDTYLRAAKMALDFSFSSLAGVIQHEVFGHGFRVRENHLSNVGYKINVFSGHTKYSSVGYDALNINRRASIASAGVEGTSVLAQKVEQTMLAERKIDRRDAMMYLVNSLDQSVFAFSLETNWFHPDNDSQLYINEVNGWYTDATDPLSKKDLKLKVAWDWANPMIYLSACSLFNYLWYGDPYITFTTWHIGKLRFMPTTRTLLSPWGPEFQLKLNLYSPSERYYGIYLRYGRTGGINSYGVDLHVNPLSTFMCFTLSNIVSAWYQPHILKNTTSIDAGNKYGFGEFLRATVQVNKYTAAFGELGYKTSGFLQGTPLSGNVVWRFGLTFSLDVNPKGADKVCEPMTFPPGPCNL